MTAVDQAAEAGTQPLTPGLRYLFAALLVATLITLWLVDVWRSRAARRRRVRALRGSDRSLERLRRERAGVGEGMRR